MGDKGIQPGEKLLGCADLRGATEGELELGDEGGREELLWRKKSIFKVISIRSEN